MDEILEKKFVSNFIVKRSQDRIIYELASGKNRKKAIDRFSHNAEDYLKSEKVVFKGEKISSLELIELIKSFGRHINKVYLISLNSYDGSYLPINEAIEIIMTDYLPNILICGDNVAMIKAESSYGASMKFILNNV